MRPRVPHLILCLIAAALLAGSVSCSSPPAPDSGSTAPATGAARSQAPTNLQELEREDGQWVMPAKNYASTRYSGLTEITTETVQDLRLAWSFSTGVLAGHEAAPLVVGDTMYVVTPFPNNLHALNLNEGETRLKWTYEPKTARVAQGVACCDVVNRGAAYSDGKVIFNTLDNHTIAVDAESGEEVWRTRLGEINLGESMTMAPLIVKDKVLVGNSGGEFGVRGWLTALNVSDGQIAWRAYTTGPDSDVLIGEDFRPFYEQDRGKDLGVTTWPADMWKIGGGTVWGWISYDPELDLIYYGTSNPGPWNPEVRPGDNKWTAGIFARNPDTGAARWAYQWSPHDLYDYDGVNENVLLDLPINGVTRKVLVRPERNGFMYVLDRETGEVLSADPFVYTTAATGVDLKTGRPIEVEAKKPGFGRVAMPNAAASSCARTAATPVTRFPACAARTGSSGRRSPGWARVSTSPATSRIRLRI